MSEQSSSNGRLPNGQFAVGNSGGPGRPRNLSTVVAELDQLAFEAAVELVRNTVDQARKGDRHAKNEILKRVWPTRRNHPVEIVPAPGNGPGNLLGEHRALADAMMSGAVTPHDARAAAQVFETLQAQMKYAEHQQWVAERQARSSARTTAGKNGENGEKR